MLHLSQLAAKYLKVDYRALETSVRDVFRVDVMTINRKKYVLVVHELTMYTLLLEAASCKTVEKTCKNIREFCPWYTGAEITLGKTSDRKIIGTVTEIRMTIEYLKQEHPPQELSAIINRMIFSILNYSTPDDCLQVYVKSCHQ
jgi:hypothetical protein